MTTALLAAKLIKVLEGCKLVAYQDSRGIWTIGYGHTHGVKQGDVCTEEQAETWFEQDSWPLLALVADRPMIEAAALVSFGYNCGLEPLHRVLRGQIQVTHEEFMVGPDPYGELAGGKRILKPRRELEAALIEASANT